MRVLLVSEGIHEEAGALEALVRRVVPHIQTCTWNRVSRNDIVTRKGKGQGFFKRAVRWMLHARSEGYDALILVIDEDGERERIRELDQAQAETVATFRFPRALGIAIHSFDARILADEAALSAALQCSIQRQPSPEDNRDPKASCRSLRDSSTVEIAIRDFYAEVARHVDLQCLSERCPKGFGIFATRLRSL